MSDKLSDIRINEIRLRLDSFLKNNADASNNSVGREIGYSSSLVSQFCNSKYPTPSTEAKFAEKVESYLNSIAATGNAVSTGHLAFAMTTAAQTIFKIAHYASSKHKIGVIVGVPGCGKTISVKEFVKRNPNNVLVEVTPFVTKRSFLRSVCMSLKIPVYNVRHDKEIAIPSDELFNEIIKVLNGTNRSLIADEGENLTTGCLEIIRRVHDFTGVGVLLSGTEKLLDRLQGIRRELKQLYSRVGIAEEISLLKTDDVKAILQVNFPEGLKYTQTFLQLSKNNGRILEHLIDLVKLTVNENDNELSVEIIDEAADSLIR